MTPAAQRLVARGLGGPPESSLLGALGKVAAANAVLGNAALALPDAHGERVIRHVYGLAADAPLAGVLAALGVEETRA